MSYLQIMSVFFQIRSLHEPAPLYLVTDPFRLCLKVCWMFFLRIASCSGVLRFLFFVVFVVVIFPSARKAALFTASRTTRLLKLHRSSVADDLLALLESFRSKNRQWWIFLRRCKSCKRTFTNPMFKLTNGLTNAGNRFTSRIRRAALVLCWSANWIGLCPSFF